MLEEQSKTSFLEWLHTKLGLYLAGIVTLLALGIGAWVPEIITVGVALPLLGLLLLCIPILLVNGAIVSNRQRAKISKLEDEVRSLSRPPVIDLPKSYSDEQHAMLISLAKSSTRNRNITHQGTLAILESLEGAGLITRRHNEFDAPWWELSGEGRRYLKDCGSI